jgi:hypothetical protein
MDECPKTTHPLSPPGPTVDSGVMPLEGHWHRQQTPLRSVRARERRLATVVAALAVVALIVTAYLVFAGDESSAPAAGCVKATAPSTTGGATVHACGTAAKRLCKQSQTERTPLASELRRQCRERGI